MNKHLFQMLGFAVAGLSMAATAQAAGVQRIANGDCAALQAAIASATSGGPTVNIVLATHGSYGYCTLSVYGTVVLDGAGADAAWNSFHGGSTTIGVIGDLTVRNLNLVRQLKGAASTASASAVAAAAAQPDFITSDPGLIFNEGRLSLENVSITGMGYVSQAPSFSYIGASPLIINGGQMILRNVSIVGNSMFYFSGPANPLISNGGQLEIYQSTLALNEVSPAGAQGALLGQSANASTKVSNSILFGNPAGICDTGVTSLGGNILSDRTCAPASNDRVVANVAFAAFGDNGGLVSTLALKDFSPAVRAGVAAFCEATDARGETRASACDAGAFQFGGSHSKVDSGGMNGFFHDLHADGNYVQVQRVGDSNAVVVWTTFDQHGHSAWVYAFGNVVGKTIHASAAQNLGGVLIPGGSTSGVSSRAWGTIDITFANCNSATFQYSSNFTEFGTGQIPLNRMASLRGLECVD